MGGQHGATSGHAEVVGFTRHAETYAKAVDARQPPATISVHEGGAAGVTDHQSGFALGPQCSIDRQRTTEAVAGEIRPVKVEHISGGSAGGVWHDDFGHVLAHADECGAAAMTDQQECAALEFAREYGWYGDGGRQRLGQSDDGQIIVNGGICWRVVRDHAAKVRMQVQGGCAASKTAVDGQAEADARWVDASDHMGGRDDMLAVDGDGAEQTTAAVQAAHASPCGLGGWVLRSAPASQSPRRRAGTQAGQHRTELAQVLSTRRDGGQRRCVAGAHRAVSGLVQPRVWEACAF